MQIEERLVQDGERQDDFLHRKLFNVNERLYKESFRYSSIVRVTVDYMKELLNTKFSNYDGLVGISGANIGVPFNIVVIRTEKEPLVMINPSYRKLNDKTGLKASNCGSLNLKEKVKVMRFEEIEVRYMTPDGKTYKKKFGGSEASTIQHEIDHNNGILITDIIEGEKAYNEK